MSQFCPDAVIFDMDGLLVDSEPLWMVVERELVEEHGRKYDPAITAKYVGMRLLEFWQGLCREYGFSETPQALMDQAIARMVARIPKQLQAKPGARELLAYFHAEGIPCAIATGSFAPVMRAVVEAFGWDSHFVVHVTGDEVERGKPDPQTYLLAAERLGVPPERCLALEDSPTGAKAAVAAGMVCYAVPDSAHTSAERFDGITPHVHDSLLTVLDAMRRCA
jgi:HAD superfamily hydrolase (TIGR01509 family)